MLQPNIRLSGATVLVTGTAGFIGANLVRRPLDDCADCRVIGIDTKVPTVRAAGYEDYVNGNMYPSPSPLWREHLRKGCQSRTVI